MTFNKTIYNSNILTTPLGKNALENSSTQNQGRQLPLLGKYGIYADDIGQRWLHLYLVL